MAESTASRIRDSHHPAWRIEAGKNSYAIWAARPAGNAVIFLHGFSGSTQKTWPHFPTLLPERKELSGHDFIFYGCEGLKARTYPSAVLFREFLEELLTQPAEAIVNPSLEPRHHRKKKFEYNAVTLVGHSTGAVVARQALLDALEQGIPGLSKIRLVFFAPAHTGASIAPFQAEMLGSSLPILVLQLGMNLFAPIWKDVLRDGETIRDLAARTTQALQGTPKAKYLIATKVILAEWDKIVSPRRFCADPIPKVLPGRDHKSVCKPRGATDEVMTELLKVL
ncbi:MAG: alpha/beta hydrolase [Acidobacteriota bacterium]|nr:alpha/beta hydrolase [Acidobacteriota bacterium]